MGKNITLFGANQGGYRAIYPRSGKNEKLHSKGKKLPGFGPPSGTHAETKADRLDELGQALNPSQMAEILGVRAGTIYCWISRGVPIPRIKICGTLRFRKEAIEAWILTQERERKKRNFEL